MARALDDKTDAMIFSLMDDLMALSLQSKDLAKITPVSYTHLTLPTIYSV